MYVLIASLIAILGIAPGAWAQSGESVDTILKKMKEVFEPAKPSTRKVTIAFSAGEETVEKVAYQARKELPDGKRMVMVMAEPDDVKGNAFLVWEPKDGTPSVVWVYSPALQHLRKLTTVGNYMHFLGTDFTYADLGFVHLHPQYKLLSKKAFDGAEAYQIEEHVPSERAYYSKIVLWIAADSLLPLQRDYYDVAGQLWKVETFGEVKEVDGVPTPLRIKMTDVQGKSSTELRVSNLRYGVEIPDKFFDPGELPAAVGLADMVAGGGAAPSN